MKTLEQLETERLEWSLETFKEATAISSLLKLEDEIKEVKWCFGDTESVDKEWLAEEYVDVLMCLFDSAGRAGISVHKLRDVFEMKLAKNKARTWVKNANNSYSHVKTGLAAVPIVVDKPNPNEKLGEGVTWEWLIDYCDPETHWEKKKILLHADTLQEVYDSFSFKFPSMRIDAIRSFGIYF